MPTDDNKARAVLQLIDREVTLDHLHALTDAELSKLRNLLLHWSDLAIPKRSNCDVCDERPWTHHGVVTGIETHYCCQCGNHEPCEE